MADQVDVDVPAPA